MAVGNYKVMGLTRRVLWVLIVGAAVVVDAGLGTGSEDDAGGASDAAASA